MEKLIFLILAVSILIFVLYLGATAIMTGFKAKGNAPNSAGKQSGGESFKISKGKVTGTTKGVGAARKQTYTWI